MEVLRANMHVTVNKYEELRKELSEQFNKKLTDIISNLAEINLIITQESEEFTDY